MGAAAVLETAAETPPTVNQLVAVAKVILIPVGVGTGFVNVLCCTYSGSRQRSPVKKFR